MVNRAKPILCKVLLRYFKLKSDQTQLFIQNISFNCKNRTFCFAVDSFNADNVTSFLNLKIYANYICLQNGSNGSDYFDYNGKVLKINNKTGPKALKDDMKSIIEKEEEFRKINRKCDGQVFDQERVLMLRNRFFKDSYK